MCFRAGFNDITLIHPTPEAITRQLTAGAPVIDISAQNCAAGNDSA
jgi:hypothetical protein